MMSQIKRRSAMAIAPLIVILCGNLISCASKPKPAVTRTVGSTNGTPFPPMNSKYSGTASGILPLASGPEAFVARLALAGKAQHTLDLQYYIWHGDQTGKLLAGAVIQAAQRGVKARLLLDDMGTAAKDRSLLILDSHPNIEVRLFNPISLRSHRMLGTLLDFKRVNRRMHNKSFTADGKVAIVGGRNIGDEYFGAANEMNFADFDVVAKGPVVREVTQAFERYWNCAAAVPISEVSGEKVPASDLEKGQRELLAHREKMEGTSYAAELRSSKLVNTPLNEIRFLKGKAVVVSDQPEKVTTRPEDASTHLAPQMREIVQNTKKEMILVSPYFIPGQEGVEWMAGLEQRGVAVKVITNSLASTDVAAVHAGYARYREALLKAGVELRELKALPTTSDAGGSGFSLTGSSKAGLHAKTFVFDRRWVFVGSMNLDPRSLKLNTEMGMIIDSPELAAQMLERVEANLPQRTYRVELTDAGLQWTTQEKGENVILKSEPKAGFKKRLLWRVCSILPIEGQL